MESFDVVILGGGIAGLSTAWHLARAGVTRTCVLEREWACGTQASGTNAAIFRQFEEDAVAVRLARRTRTLLEELSPTEPLLRATGAVYVGSAARLAESVQQLTAHGIEVRRVTADELRALAPPVVLGARHDAALVPSDGVLDPHGMIQALLARLRAAGVVVRVSSGATSIRREGASSGPTSADDAFRATSPGDASSGTTSADETARATSGGDASTGSSANEAARSPRGDASIVSASAHETVAQSDAAFAESTVRRSTQPSGGFIVSTSTGPLRATHLVLAGGAWNAELGASLGAPAPLAPLRRHLALLETGAAAVGGPVVWRLEDDEAYYRPESGGVLASPCDETAWPATTDVPMDARALVSLGERLSTLAPELADAQVRRAWGCLRTFAPDRQFAAGPDARVPGLHWCAGLGGRGMSCGLALGELVANALIGRTAVPVEVALSRLAR